MWLLKIHVAGMYRSLINHAIQQNYENVYTVSLCT